MFISTLAIKRPVFTAMVIIAMIVFGWVSLRSLSLDLFPKVDFPIVTVRTPLLGADPETVETRVTDPLEQAVNAIAGVKKLQSTSMEGLSVLVIEFSLDKNIDVAYQEVQQKISGARSELPLDAEDSVIEKVDVDAAPILQVIVSGDKSPRELYYAADVQIRERLQRVRDVGAITIKGGRDRKLWLWLDPVALKQANLTVQDVRGALAAQHVEMPGGRLEQSAKEYVTRVKAEFTSAAALNELIVSGHGADAIRLGDIGHAEDGLEEERSYAQLGDQPCLTLEIQRQSGKNTVQVAADLKAEIAKLQQELSPRGISLQVAVDMSVYIRQSVDQVFHHLIIGGALAVFVVMVFLLNYRSTFISAMVLPTSIMATFMMMAAAGYSLNFMTLMGLTLAIGLLIDDAIVVQENIMRHVQEGKPASFAAEFATKEIGLAVFATTMSVVAVFLPTAYTEGIVGRFFAPFGMTVAFAVLISMFVSFTLDPMLSSRMLKKQTHMNPVFRFLEDSFMAMERKYERLLAWCLNRRLLVVGIALVAFIGSMTLGRFLKSEFLPEEDRSEFNVVMRAPLGSSLRTARSIMDELREAVVSLPEVKYTLCTVGGDKVNEGSIYVRLHEKADRLKKGERSQRQVMDELRDRLPRVAAPRNTIVGVQRFDAIASSAGMKAAMLQYELLGSDLTTLDGMAQQLLGKMRQAGGYKDLDTTYQPGKPEVSIYVNRERASERGVTPADIASTVRAAIGGVDIGKFRDGKERYDIAVRFLESGRIEPEQILDLQVPSRSGEPVELRTVAQVAPTQVPVEINRYNRQRQITVLANLDAGNSLGEAITEIDGFMKGVEMPPGYGTAWSGEAENMQESFGYMAFTMLLSVIVVYMVLAAQFESLVHPFTIMLSLPLAFVGAMVFLVTFGQTLNIFTIMAFIFLLGLVTKNAILLIDYANTLRERDGLERDLAMQKAGPVRLRPILMTTFAMIFGMLPSAMGAGEGSESQRPMAIAIIGGLVSSTFLTLVIVPVVYSLLDPLSEWMRRRVLALRKTPHVVHAADAIRTQEETPV
jgi:HAE1 family hydrophobic/amphiphilic exporter-1